MVDLAHLLLAQASEQRGDLRAAATWLDKIEPARVDMPTLARRASLLAHAGKVAQARALVREAPARDEPDARTRLLAEAQVLRDRRQWAEAYELLLGGLRQNPDDTTLMYELAMVADRLERHDDMEALLRRVIALKPDNQHAPTRRLLLADRNCGLSKRWGWCTPPASRRTTPSSSMVAGAVPPRPPRRGAQAAAPLACRATPRRGGGAPGRGAVVHGPAR
jgi:tetratricopeptide (TPR) repeat protein